MEGPARGSKEQEGLAWVVPGRDLKADGERRTWESLWSGCVCKHWPVVRTRPWLNVYSGGRSDQLPAFSWCQLGCPGCVCGRGRLGSADVGWSTGLPWASLHIFHCLIEVLQCLVNKDILLSCFMFWCWKMCNGRKQCFCVIFSWITFHVVRSLTGAVIASLTNGVPAHKIANAFWELKRTTLHALMTQFFH